MKVICKHNSLNDISKNLRKYAFTQADDGSLDITVGKEYLVFGTRRTPKGHKFYLVNTDSVHLSAPWWMPSELYEVVDDTIPKKWITKKHGFLKNDKITAPRAYHGNENAIEDNEASDTVMKEIYEDSK